MDFLEERGQREKRDLANVQGKIGTPYSPRLAGMYNIIFSIRLLLINKLGCRQLTP